MNGALALSANRSLCIVPTQAEVCGVHLLRQNFGKAARNSFFFFPLLLLFVIAIPNHVGTL